jgi:POT family proton-dependent oligopeptide transporter
MLPITSNPPGLAYLRVAIAGHAFAWYSLYNLFVLWLVSRGFSDGDATSAFGNLVFAAYVLPLLGGVVADGVSIRMPWLRWQEECFDLPGGIFCVEEWRLVWTRRVFKLPPLGLRRTAVVGAAVAVLGYAIASLTSRPFTGVAFVALGCGFIKPTLTTMVGRLFPTGGHIADRAFSRFYAAINIGAVIAPLLGGWLAVRYGYLAALAVGALGDVVAGVAVLLGYRALAVADARSELAAVLAAAVDVSQVAESKAAEHDPRKTTALLLFFIVAALGFWPAYSQNGSGLSLWAAHHTALTVTLAGFSMNVPPIWFAAVNSILCIVAASPIVSLFGRGRLSVTAVIGYVLVAASSLCIVIAPLNNASPLYLLAAITLGSAAEILISTIGMAQVTRLAPRESATTWTAIMYLTIAVGGKLSGVLGSVTAGRGLQGGFLVLGVVGLAAAAVSWLLRRRLDVAA